MADIKACGLTEPHRVHNWQESEPYDGFVPQMIPLYHVCPGIVRSEEDQGPAANCHLCVGAGGYEDHDGTWVACSCQRRDYRLVGVDYDALQRRYQEALAQIHGQEPGRTYTVAEVKELIYSLDPRPAEALPNHCQECGVWGSQEAHLRTCSRYRKEY